MCKIIVFYFIFLRVGGGGSGEGRGVDFITRSRGPLKSYKTFFNVFTNSALSLARTSANACYSTAQSTAYFDSI